MKVKEKVKKIKDKKYLLIQLSSLLASIIIVALGGVKMLTIIIIFVFGIVVGKYYEKAMSAIKDYRLVQKLNRLEFDKQKFSLMKEENDNLKKQLNNILGMVGGGPRGASMPPTPPTYHSQDNYIYNGGYKD